jgi:hypothetical protein
MRHFSVSSLSGFGADDAPTPSRPRRRDALSRRNAEKRALKSTACAY